jgi:hypothetical protein
MLLTLLQGPTKVTSRAPVGGEARGEVTAVCDVRSRTIPSDARERQSLAESGAEGSSTSLPFLDLVPELPRRSKWPAEGNATKGGRCHRRCTADAL